MKISYLDWNWDKKMKIGDFGYKKSTQNHSINKVNGRENIEREREKIMAEKDKLKRERVHHSYLLK